MSKKERLEDIMALIRQNQYVTVKYLTDELHYSTATINRDLNLLEKQSLIKRNYGGAELVKSESVPLLFRYHKMRYAKRKIAMKASEFVEDGDIIFIDGSTTCQYMAQYILEKKDITVLTNNMSLSAYLSENGINCICLGGRVVEPPSMLGGIVTVENAKKFKADKCFFSTRNVYENGEIGTTELYYSLHTAMIENSEKSFFLVDSGKLKNKKGIILCDFSKIHCVISDCDFKNTENFPSTEIINVSSQARANSVK